MTQEPDYGSGARAVPRTQPHQPRYIRITDFGDDGIEPGHDYVTADPIEEDCELAAEDLLFARSGATVGKTYLHEDTSVPAIFAGYCIRFKFNAKKASPRFVYYFTKTSTYERWAAAIQRPSGQPNINKEEFKSLQLPLPSLTKQGELVAAMDAARADRHRKLAEADSLMQGGDSAVLGLLGLASPPADHRRIFAHSLSTLIAAGRVDPGYHRPVYKAVEAILSASPYPLRTIAALCDGPVGGATPTKGDSEAYATSGVRFLRICNVRPNEFDLTDLNFIQTSVHEGELKRSQLAADDVVMTITGRVGTAAVVTPNLLPANINQHLVRLRVRGDACVPEYLAAYLNTSLGLAVSNRGVTGGTRIALDYGTIRALPIPVPPPAVQEAVVDEIHRRRDAARRLRSEAEADWQAAKACFEEQLLGAKTP